MVPCGRIRTRNFELLLKMPSPVEEWSARCLMAHASGSVQPCLLNHDPHSHCCLQQHSFEAVNGSYLVLCESFSAPVLNDIRFIPQSHQGNSSLILLYFSQLQLQFHFCPSTHPQPPYDLEKYLFRSVQLLRYLPDPYHYKHPIRAIPYALPSPNHTSHFPKTSSLLLYHVCQRRSSPEAKKQPNIGHRKTQETAQAGEWNADSGRCHSSKWLRVRRRGRLKFHAHNQHDFSGRRLARVAGHHRESDQECGLDPFLPDMLLRYRPLDLQPGHRFRRGL